MEESREGSSLFYQESAGRAAAGKLGFRETLKSGYD